MCAQIGTFVSATVSPPATSSLSDVATAFVVGLADWGPTSPIPVTSIGNMASSVGSPSGSGSPYASRTATCATLFDSLETFFGEGGYRAYVARVVGTNPVKATLVLQDISAATALTLTAKYVGVGGNAINVAVTNSGSAYVITLQDASGNVIQTSPSFTTNAAAVTWAATTSYITAVAGGGGLAKTLSATPLAGGTDDRGTANLASWQTSIATFTSSLGPGQVLAPGQTNTGLNGIWSALGLHAQTSNRVAICDMDDNVSAATLISNIDGFGATNVGTYCGFWAGNLQLTGVVPNTTRSVPPSAAIAGLCARVAPSGQGNVNTAGAGVAWPLQYATQNVSQVTGPQGVEYSANDLYTLADSGINTFQSHNNLFVNYGFRSSISPTSDAIYWQFNHGRTRMALIADAQVIGEPFVFSQIDGQGSDQAAFQSALQGMLHSYYDAGALFGTTPADAFSVDASNAVNPITSIQAGRLNAVARVRLSPYAELVTINLNAISISASV